MPYIDLVLWLPTRAGRRAQAKKLGVSQRDAEKRFLAQQQEKAAIRAKYNTEGCATGSISCSQLNRANGPSVRHDAAVFHRPSLVDFQQEALPTADFIGTQPPAVVVENKMTPSNYKALVVEQVERDTREVILLREAYADAHHRHRAWRAAANLLTVPASILGALAANNHDMVSAVILWMIAGCVLAAAVVDHLAERRP